MAIKLVSFVFIAAAAVIALLVADFAFDQEASVKIGKEIDQSLLCTDHSLFSTRARGAAAGRMSAPFRHPQQNVPRNLRAQVEYYFSDDNLKNDNFLKSHMSADGTCAVTVLAGFKRVIDFSIGGDVVTSLKEAIRGSKLLELTATNGVLSVRRLRPYTLRESVAGAAPKFTGSCIRRGAFFRLTTNF